MPVAVGEPAPDAVLFHRPEETVRIHDYLGAGPVVLLFFPLAFSAVCTEEVCEVAHDWPEWQSVGARVLAISVDSPYANQKFAEECGALFPVLSDFNREASRAYGVLRSDVGGLKDVSERAAFVIGRDGRIAYAWVGEHPGVYPPLEEIHRAAAEAG